MNLFSKKTNPQTKPAPAPLSNNGRQFKTVAYYLAWLAYVSAVGAALVAALSKQEPPEKNDYYK